MRTPLILIIFLFFASCAKKPAEEVDEAIDLAQTYLTQNKCDEAIDVLEDVGRETSNPIYLQVLASAYACRAGFSEINFLTDEIGKLSGVDATSLMPALTTFQWSDQDEADSDDYQDMRTALQVLLSGGSTQADRDDAFGPRKAGDIGVQILLLGLTQLGKFLHFYGNVDSTGAKGGGDPDEDEQGATASTCFIEYTGADALTFINGGGGGVCNNMAIDDGHPDMSLAVADLDTTKRRMCEGLMLVTNIMDVLENITLPDNDTFDDLQDIVGVVDDFKTVILAADPALGTLIGTTSQVDCEELVEDNTEFDRLQYIYALLFEAGLP